MKLDFSAFHPLDHSLWRCRDYPGGRLQHLEFWWQYQASERLVVAWKHATRRHEWQAYGWRDRETGEWLYAAGCAGCDAKPDWVTEDRLTAEMKARPMPDFDT